MPKVVSGGARIVSVSKPIDTAARKDDKQGMDDLLYTIYHKHYKNDQRRDQGKYHFKKTILVHPICYYSVPMTTFRTSSSGSILLIISSISVTMKG